MIKAIIFDVGGVLVRTVDPSGRRHWEAKLGLQAGDVEDIVFNSSMGVRAQLGEITNAELWHWVGKRLKLAEAHLKAFHEAFWSGDVLDEELVDLIRSLRPGYQTAVISNSTDALRSTLVSKYPIADAFNLIVSSAEERVMKPDPVIFNRTLERLGRSAAESVFVDDFARNVAAAQELGMKAMHYAPGMNLTDKLTELGVEI